MVPDQHTVYHIDNLLVRDNSNKLYTSNNIIICMQEDKGN